MVGHSRVRIKFHLVPVSMKLVGQIRMVMVVNGMNDMIIQVVQTMAITGPIQQLVLRPMKLAATVNSKRT